MNEIQKPITVAREEFKQNILKLCESSGLPFFIVEDVLKYLFEQIHLASLEQYKIDKAKYEQTLKNQGTQTE